MYPLGYTPVWDHSGLVSLIYSQHLLESSCCFTESIQGRRRCAVKVHSPPFTLYSLLVVIFYTKLKKIYNAEVSIPSSLVAAKKTSEQKSPELIIADIEYGQSELDVKIARSDLSPTAKLSLERTYVDDLSATYDEREKDVLQATVSWPFQFGGKNRSNVNKNLQVKGMKKLLLENAYRNNTQSVTAAWSTLESSKSLLRAVQTQVKAAEIANEGISFEYESGLNRSTFDVLQSRSNLISAKINLAEAERNYLLAQYRLIKSVGLLNSEYLKLR